MKIRRYLALTFAALMFLQGCAQVPPAVTDGSVTSDTPVTESPVTENTVTEAPVTDAPTTEPPVTDAPIADVPVTDVPPVVNVELPVLPEDSYFTVFPMFAGPYNRWDDDYDLDEYEFFRYENLDLEERLANINYNKDADGNVQGVYSFRPLNGEEREKFYYQYSFTVEGGHLFTPHMDVSHIKDITNVTGVLIRNVTFTGKNAVLVEDGEYDSVFVENYYVDADNENYNSADGVLFSEDGKTLVLFPGFRSGHYDIPEGTEKVAPNAFYASGIESLGFPSTLKTVGDSLVHASALRIIRFPDTDVQATIGNTYAYAAYDSVGVTKYYRPHASILAVYNGDNVDDPVFSHPAFCAVVRDSEDWVPYREEGDVLVVLPGTRSLLQLEKYNLSEKHYSKVILPLSLLSVAGAHKLKTDAYEMEVLGTHASALFVEDGIVYGYEYTDGLFGISRSEVLVAYPTQKSAELAGLRTSYIGVSAFRNSRLKGIEFGYPPSVMPHAFEGCNELEYYKRAGNGNGVILFTEPQIKETEFLLTPSGKGGFPIFGEVTWVIYSDGTAKKAEFKYSIEGTSSPK